MLLGIAAKLPTVYGLLRCRPLNVFLKPSRVTGAKWKHRVKYVAYSQKVHMTQADLQSFPPVYHMVCLNKPLSLGLCDPRRCIRYIGYITPVYPRHEYSAVVQLYWALFGTEGYRLHANPECKYNARDANPECKYNAVERLFGTQRGTKGYCLGALSKCKYYHLGIAPMLQYIAEGKKVVASSTGTLPLCKYMCNADSKKVTTFQRLQHMAEGKKVPTFETLFCLMLICLWVLILSTELSVASSWLRVHCLALLSTEFSIAPCWLLAHYLAHYGNQGNLTSFHNGFERIALRSTKQGNWNSFRNGFGRIVPCASRSTLAGILTRNVGSQRLYMVALGYEPIASLIAKKSR